MDSKKSSLYKGAYENFDVNGPYKLGPLTSEKMRVDPQYVMFQMSRYKHAARLMANKNNIIDIGSGDGVGLPILCSYFENVTSIDIDKFMQENSIKSLDRKFSCDFLLHDFSKAKLSQKYDAATAFDVLSLIPNEQEKLWLKNVSRSLKRDGILVIGTQNKNMTQFGNPMNHVDQPNFKTYEELNNLLLLYFQNVVTLSMNDETIHSGKRETCQYFLALGICPIE